MEIFGLAVQFSPPGLPEVWHRCKFMAAANRKFDSSLSETDREGSELSILGASSLRVGPLSQSLLQAGPF